jgi:hypothetical protein
MTADTVKSGSITNLDSSPVVANTSGLSGPFLVKVARDYVAATAAGLASTSSVYKAVRLPSNCYVKKVSAVADAVMDSNASPTLALNVGAYYSDSTVDGTKAANQGVLISATAFISAATFGKNIAASPLVVTSDGNWTAVKRQQLLWAALGLSADPGGQIDVVVAVEAVAATAVAGNIDVAVEYAMP